VQANESGIIIPATRDNPAVQTPLHMDWGEVPVEDKERPYRRESTLRAARFWGWLGPARWAWSIGLD